MKLHPIDLTIIACYVVLVIVTGWILSRRAGKNLDSYFLGGKSIPWYILGISHGAAGFDIAGTMWFVLMLYTYGLKGVWILWMWPMFAMVFRMMYLGQWIRRSNALTGAEWMRTRFGAGRGGNLAHISVVVYALISVVGFLSMAFQGIGKFAQPFFPWDLSPETYGLAMMLITAAYLVVGGMYSVILTDIMQYILLVISSIGIAAIALSQTSYEQIQAAVPEGWSSIFIGWNLNVDWSETMPALMQQFESDHSSLFALFTGMMLAKGVVVSMAGPSPGYGMQNVLATRNPREAALESGWMTVTAFLPRFLLIGAIVILALGPLNTDMQTMEGDVDFEQLLPTVISRYVPIGLTGLVVAGLLAAFMSTFDSTVNAASAYIVNDIYKRYLFPEATDKTLIYMSYATSVFVIFLGIVFGYLTESIHSVTLFIVSALFGAYTVPNVLKWHWWRFNSYGFFAGMVSGLAAALAFMGIDKIFTNAPNALDSLGPSVQSLGNAIAGLTPLEAFPFIIAVSAIASVAVSLATPPESPEILESFYRSVRPWGFWGPVRRSIAQKDPSFPTQSSFGRDTMNCALGIVWQTTFVTTPIYFMLREYQAMAVSIALLLGLSALLKFTWYDRLESEETIASSH